MTERNESAVERKYGTLYSMGRLLVLAGWVVGAIGLITGLGMIFGVFMSAGMTGMHMGMGMAGGVLGGLWVVITALIFGFILAAQGQAMQCLVSIEENTRRSARSTSDD